MPTDADRKSTESKSSEHGDHKDRNMSTMEGQHGIPAEKLIESRCIIDVPEKGGSKVRESAIIDSVGPNGPVPTRHPWKKSRRLTAFKAILMAFFFLVLASSLMALFLRPDEWLFVFITINMMTLVIIFIIIRLARITK